MQERLTPWSIPACAGEPPQVHRSHRGQGVYPRVCGGTVQTWLDFDAQLGLSPRVRGNPLDRYSPGAVRGSIPACAGEPGAAHLNSLRWKVLSPRVRGNPSAAASAAKNPRSIPACAGEPSRLKPSPLPHTVYPRVCGGTWSISQVASAHDRSIPACAGEPHVDVESPLCAAVYPRVCGGTMPPPCALNP